MIKLRDERNEIYEKETDITNYVYKSFYRDYYKRERRVNLETFIYLCPHIVER